MQVSFHEALFLFGMCSVAACIFLSILTFLMYPLTPKSVVKKYFKPPYFSEAFVEFYSGFPAVLFRGAMFMRLAAFPSSGKKRNLTHVYKEFPIWYIHISKILLVAFFVSFILLVISMVAFAIVFGF